MAVKGNLSSIFVIMISVLKISAVKGFHQSCCKSNFVNVDVGTKSAMDLPTSFDLVCHQFEPKALSQVPGL